jgi:hypothetical protein
MLNTAVWSRILDAELVSAALRVAGAAGRTISWLVKSGSVRLRVIRDRRRMGGTITATTTRLHAFSWRYAAAATTTRWCVVHPQTFGLITRNGVGELVLRRSV